VVLSRGLYLSSSKPTGQDTISIEINFINPVLVTAYVQQEEHRCNLNPNSFVQKLYRVGPSI
jgi:hypothetical protein